MKKDSNGKQPSPNKYYLPKKENLLFSERLKAACDQKGIGRADLARELVKRRVMSADPKDPTEPSARGRVHYWFSAKVRPNRKIQAAICDILDKPIAYFTDPDYTDDINEQVVRRLSEILLRVARTGGSMVQHAEQVLGTPHLMDTSRRREFTAGEAGLVRALQSMAPRPWDEMTATEQREFVEEMLRQQSPG
jgi:transcriptional regulator with XRE-family HTH domain